MVFPKINPHDPKVVSDSLEMTRGYCYTVKPGMGNIMRNFNLATSAFFKPILVSEFLADPRTFTENVRRDQLIGLDILVMSERMGETGDDSERKSIPKTIKGFSRDNIGSINFHARLKDDKGEFLKDDHDAFRLATSETAVVDHLGQSKSAEPRMYALLSLSSFQQPYHRSKPSGCKLRYGQGSHLVRRRATSNYPMAGSAQTCTYFIDGRYG